MQFGTIFELHKEIFGHAPTKNEIEEYKFLKSELLRYRHDRGLS